METRRRIALLVPGGIGREDYIPSLLDLLIRLGEHYELSIYSFSRTKVHPRLLAMGFTVTLPPAAIEQSSVLKSFYYLWRIRKDAVRLGFGAVHGFWTLPQGTTAVLAGKLLGVPSIVSILGGDIVYLPRIDYGGMRSPLHRFVVRWTIGAADRVTVLTTFQRRVMASSRITSASVSEIPFGPDLSKFAYLSRDIASVPRFGFIGNINKVKDPFTLLSTFAILSRTIECTLTIAGPDLLNGRVQKHAKLLGVDDKIRWLGKVAHDSIPSLLSSLDFLLLTSLYEGEGVVVMEAFASGVIVAGTRVGLLADRGDEGVTVDPSDAEGLAAKILQLMRNPARLQAIREGNRKIAEEWTADRTGSEFIRLYEELMRSAA